MQGVARREYCPYCPGLQRRSGAHRPLPKGAIPMACGGVAPLGNGRRHSRRGRALPQTMGNALMRRYLFDTALVSHAMLLHSGVGSSLWSISRGLARNVTEYKTKARGRAPEITGYQERRSRQILSTLLKKGLLVSNGPRAPVRLGFPFAVAERWFPRLYPVD